MEQDQEAVEYMLFLKQNASELRKLGSDWGLSEEEINGCINEALSQVNPSTNADANSRKNVARKIWSYILFLMKIPIYTFLLLVTILFLTSTLCSVHEPTDTAINRLLAPYGYTIFRFIRIATLPLHRMTDVTSYYDSECIVDNPFYTDASSNCYGCINVKEVSEVEAASANTSRLVKYIALMKPVLYKKSVSRPVSYQDLRENYLENQEAYGEGLHTFESTVSGISSPQDLFVEDCSELVNKAAGIHAIWQSRKVKISVGLRKLFPRPIFLPDKIEIALEKHVFIDSQETPTYELPVTVGDAMIYTLASGHRRVLVKPVSQCAEKCQSQLVFMEPGDSLLINQAVWRVFIAGKGQDAAVGYIMPIGT